MNDEFPPPHLRRSNPHALTADCRTSIVTSSHKGYQAKAGL
ncbi:MAG: hypothetical protein OJF47_003972 [Nitrospira sp.]|nr:MAG: hypothetical protein OJF47_003972 [Nitrospira sp.]